MVNPVPGYEVNPAPPGRSAVVYGPVMDPRGGYGIAVVEVDGEAAANHIAERDPAIAAEAGFSFEVHVMPDTKVRQ